MNTSAPRWLRHTLQYPDDFRRCLVDCEGFLREQLARKPDEEIVAKAVVFFVCSSLITALLFWLLPYVELQQSVADPVRLIRLLKGRSLLVQFATDLVTGPFDLLGIATIFYFSWSATGLRPTIQQCFGLAAFLLSIMLVFNTVIQSIPAAARLDPLVAAQLLAREAHTRQLRPVLAPVLCARDRVTGQLPAAASAQAAVFARLRQRIEGTQAAIAARPITRLVQGVQGVCRGVLLLWFIAAWFAFGRALAASAQAWLLSLGPALAGVMLLERLLMAMEASGLARRFHSGC